MLNVNLFVLLVIFCLVTGESCRKNKRTERNLKLLRKEQKKLDLTRPSKIYLLFDFHAFLRKSCLVAEKTLEMRRKEKKIMEIERFN